MIADGGQGGVFSLVDGTTMSVGRQGSNDIVLEDGSVSRSHCLIYVHPGKVEIEDLDSTNGVQVSGKKVRGRTPVPVDKELRIGNLRFVLTEAREDVCPTDTFVMPQMPKPKPESEA
jgi:pSer/pThr/pTyr-binding forkhead associated (FHA) protein